ncbi:complement decay-accelerating factor isoform X2 [Dicentrarchus labrax]|uniref:Sushi domain-containing protein n=1 Tax=Dicentrarchus labrax TaxID=13489 RepID=A0A8C4GMX6_DICLA|nr:complement decay-accelerating factor isoform X2 [Dicentrarchus labrax]
MEVLLDTCERRRVRHLLLMYLFVVKAAADCPKPQGKGNIVLTNEALLKNNFPDASSVTFECVNGYVQENGTGIITCVSGTWTEPDIICIKKDCGPPKPQPNMSFNISDGTLFGAVIKVVCAKGYQVIGSSYKQCYSVGWTGRAKCQIVTCRAPDGVTNGKNNWDSSDEPKYGEIIHYDCDEGYTLVGNDEITCSETGEYDSQPPECKGVTTEGRITTEMATPTTPIYTQEASTSTGPSTTRTAHRDKTITTSPTTAVPPSTKGGRGLLAAEDKATTASVTAPTSFQGKNDGAVDTNQDNGYIPVIISVVSISIAVPIVVLFLHKYLLKRKGSANGSFPI